MHHGDPEVECDMAASVGDTHTGQEALQEHQQSSMAVPACAA